MRASVRPTVAAVDSLVQWVEPVVDGLGLGPFLETVPRMLADGNGAMFQLRRLDEIGDPRAVHAEVVERTRESAKEVLASFPTPKVSR